ncbi:MAG TPA: DUF6703 family protein [Mycobacteriales bacterium]|nr:DUF6703 family protein [Mycobacteriales bacterium]
MPKSKPRPRATPARRTTRPSGSTTPKSTPFLTPNASPFRREVERRSAIVVLFLKGLPKALPALIVLAILAGGLALPGPLGVVCYVVSVAILTWLVYLSWPALAPTGRAIRIAVIGAVVVMVGGRFFN